MIKYSEAKRDSASDTIVPIDFSPNTDVSGEGKFKLRWFHALVIGFVLISSAAIYFILSARSVSVLPLPASAEISIKGGLTFRLGPRYLLLPGEYQITLKNPGYYDTAEQLIVGSDEFQSFPFEMRKLPGLISVNANSVLGARVQIDGVDVGTTPLVDIEVEPGDRQLVLSNERYLESLIAITVEGKSIRQTVDAIMEPAWANYSFETSPSGAEVIVGGEVLGVTPLSAEIIQGRQSVTVKLSRHKAWQDIFDVVAGEDITVPKITLEPAEGIIFISSIPTQASVTIDGQFKGLTPLEVMLSPDEDHEISFYKDGYSSFKRNVRISPTEERALRIELEPVLADVSVVADPPDALLFVNGELQGPANQTIPLLASNQNIEIRKEGFVPYSAEFTARPGLDQEIRVKLKSLEEAKLESIRPEISTAAGQTLKLFYPHAFTMGASRREAGRRPNENLRDIDLRRPFYLASHEVTNAEFRLFEKTHSSGTLQGISLDNGSHPVVRISWSQAAIYCNWLSEQEGLPSYYIVEGDEVTGFNSDSIGYRLPTEAEWAWAARTEGSGRVLKYPWGEQLPPPGNSGNFADITVRNYLAEIMFDYNDGFFATAPTGSFSPNYHGIYDMAGNVSEWVHDFYGSVGAVGGPELDPKGAEMGQFHTIRGSSWAHGAVTEMRLSFRDFGVEPRDDVGFRIARYLEEI